MEKNSKASMIGLRRYVLSFGTNQIEQFLTVNDGFDNFQKYQMPYIFSEEPRMWLKLHLELINTVTESSDTCSYFYLTPH